MSNQSERLSAALSDRYRIERELAAFDLSPDGKTFVMVTPAQRSGGAVIAVDWANEARREWNRSVRK